MLKSTEKHVIVWGARCRTDGISARHSLKKSCSTLIYYNGERWRTLNKSRDIQIFVSAGIILPPIGVWRLTKPVWKCRRLYSVREVQVLLPVATSSSRSGQWGDFWERLQHPSCLSDAFFHCFAAEMLMFPNTGALLTGELTPAWSRSWMQIERTRELYPC